MVDIVIVAKTVLQMHIIINGSYDIFLCNVLGNQFMYIFLESVRQLFGVVRKFVQYPFQHGIVYHLMNAEIPGIALYIMRQIDHHIGENLHVLLLGLDIYKRNRRILNGFGKLRRHLVSRGGKDLAGGRVHHIRGKNLVPDPVAKRQLLIKLISAHLGQVIPAGVKEHGIDQAFRTLHAQGLAGTNLFI